MTALYLFWPGKPVPVWFQEIRFTARQCQANPYVAHGGFGVVVKSRGEYHVKTITGACITMINCNDITVTGGGNGVIYYSSLSGWVRGILKWEPA